MPKEKPGPVSSNDLLVTAAERVATSSARYRTAAKAMEEYQKRHDALDKELAEAKLDMGEAKQQMIDAVDACAHEP